MAKNSDLVTIIMSVYNETIDMVTKSSYSVLHQSYNNLQFIIVNDNPLRSDLDVFFRRLSNLDNRVIYLKNSKNFGLVKSLNFALNYANGTYVARMDADDISDLYRIEKQLSYIKKNNLDMIGSKLTLIDEYDNIIGKVDVPIKHRKIANYYKIGVCLPHPSWLLKKEIYTKLEGYRNIFSCEDYDFALRAINAGFKLGNHPENLLKYRIRNSSISNSSRVKQILLTYLISDYYRRNMIIPLEVVDRYLSSKQYQNDSVLLEHYLFSKIRLKNNKTMISMFKSILFILFNKYFYKAICRVAYKLTFKLNTSI